MRRSPLGSRVQSSVGAQAALGVRSSVRNTVVMVVLAIIAAATWILTWQRMDVDPLLVDRAAEPGPLGYYARGAHLTGWDEQGRLRYRIFAERLEELPGEERLQL